METLYKLTEIQTFKNIMNQDFGNAILIFNDVNHSKIMKTVTVNKSWCSIQENQKIVHMLLTADEIDRIGNE